MFKLTLLIRISSLFIPVLTAGCLLGPDYQRPDLALPESHDTTLEVEQAAKLIDLPWFDLFQDTELSTLIRKAVANNLDLQLALDRIDEAKARLVLANRNLLPNVIGQLSTAPLPGDAGSNDSSFTRGLALSWEIDIFGKLRRASEVSRAELLASEETARGVMATLVTQVAINWLTLRELEEEMAILRKTIDNQEASLALVRLLLENGVASGAEEQQAIAQLAATKAILPTVELQQVFATNTLAILLGDYPQSFMINAPSGLSALLDPGHVNPGLPSELLQRRPDVRVAENQLHAATASVGIAIANRFPVPNLGLTALVGQVSNGVFGGDTSTNVTSWGPFANVPIIDFGRAQANVDVAQAQTAQALLVYKSTVLQAMREVSDSLASYEMSAEVVAANKEFVQAADKSLELIRLRYKAGVTNFLNVLDAERQLLTAELNHARAYLSRLVAFLNIYLAVGGGWSDEEIIRLMLEKSQPVMTADPESS